MKSNEGQEVRPELTDKGTSVVELEQEVQPGQRVSPKRAEASRRNGSKSRGPTTAVGKKTVSRNAVKLGIFSSELVIRDRDGRESQAEFDQLFSELCDSYGPEGRAEELCVEEIAVCYWLFRRAQRFENGEITRNLATRRHYIRYPDPLELGLISQTPSDPELDSIVDDLALPSREDTDKLVEVRNEDQQTVEPCGRRISEAAETKKEWGQQSGTKSYKMILQNKPSKCFYFQ
jgi:hypothetical protein